MLEKQQQQQQQLNDNKKTKAKTSAFTKFYIKKYIFKSISLPKHGLTNLQIISQLLPVSNFNIARRAWLN